MKKADIHVFSMEEGEGFEPPVVLPTAVFKTTALNHSATFPPLIVPQFFLKNKIKDILTAIILGLCFAALALEYFDILTK